MSTRPRWTSQRRGFMFIELINSVAISVVVVIVTTGIFFLLLRTYFLYNARTVLISEASTVVERFTDDVQSATTVLTSATVLGTQYTTDKDTLVLKVNGTNVQGDIVSASYDTIVLTVDPGHAGRLLEVVDADAQSVRKDATKQLSDALLDVTFTFTTVAPSNTSAVFLSLTLKTDVRLTSVIYTLNSYAKLRNK